jgi:hypothetical protein
MGAELYFYVTPISGTPQDALDRLRAQTFASGEYNGSHLKPQSPDDAVKVTEPEGTRSILDVSRISDTPDYFAASPFSDEELEDYFGTSKPTLEQVKARRSVAADSIGRGSARYFVACDAAGRPCHYVFMGYSFD